MQRLTLIRRASRSTSSTRYAGVLLVGMAGIASQSAACSSDDPPVTSSSACDDLEPVANTEYCEPEAVETNCDLITSAFTNVACGVALQTPPGELSRSANVDEFGGSGSPDLSCFQEGSYPDLPGESQKVTMTGIAKIFSNGCNSGDLTIEVFEVGADGDLGAMVGEAVVTDEDCSENGVAAEEADCDPRYECVYSYPDVDTEKHLVVKTSGADWTDLYQYNIYIPNDEVVDGEWENDVRALARPDYTTIPQVAIGGPVTTGNGVLAGEVHDCGNVRVINAVADIDKSKATLTYFTEDEDNPLPDLSKDGTSSLGLYSAMDVTPGPVTVTAAGLVNGEVVSLGFHTVRIFPDSVTSVTFRGLRPFQVPSE